MKEFGGLLAGRAASFNSTCEGFFSLVLARLSYQKTGFFFLIAFFVFFETIFAHTSIAVSAGEPNFFNLSAPKEVQTKSLFKEVETKKTTTINFPHHTIVDLSLAPNQKQVLTKGSPGRKTYSTKIVYHAGQEFSRETLLTEDIKPTEEVVASGLAEGEMTLETPLGLLKYNRQLTVWATSYDANCKGCNATTALGLKAGFGVIAVDPKVIPLGSKIYVPGYGIAIAGDTGASIKGNKVDLGFDNVKNGWWSSRYTPLYILTS